MTGSPKDVQISPGCERIPLAADVVSFNPVLKNANKVSTLCKFRRALVAEMVGISMGEFRGP
jgi:hypothetical protein